MKGLTPLFLIIIVFYSSLAFCCEEEKTCLDNELIDCENDQSENHDENFPCSPFFACGNCTGNIVINIPLVFENTSMEPRFTYSLFMENYYQKEPHFRLLKPPMQLS